MSNYVDTIVLECSRTSSAEGIANNNKNPAEYTNELGDGVVLKIGDEIQLHSAYISELGAEAGQIEIKERITGQVVTAEVTDYAKYYRLESLPTKYEWEVCSASNVVVNVNDKETYMVVSPYKTTNGEFTMCLPRRYAVETNTTAANWNYFGTTNEPGTNNLGNVINTLWAQVTTGTVTAQHPSQFCPADYEIVYKTQTKPDTLYKGQVKNNNQRFTIMRAAEIFFNENAAVSYSESNSSMAGLTALTANASSWVQQEYANKRDPACMLDWMQVKDMVKMEAKDGFNSPTDVAFDLTQQLNSRSNFVNKKFPIATGNGDIDGGYQDITLTSYTETPCYKVYNCGTPNKMNASEWAAFRDAKSNVSDTEVDAAYNYLSSYQHIGVKRPDLFTEGRLLNASQGFLIPEGTNIPEASPTLNTGIEWSEENIAQFDEYFRIQGTYPELFDGLVQSTISCSATLNRFFHFNVYDEVYHNPLDSLGFDLYEFGRTGALFEGKIYNASMATYPLFFDYNPETAHLKANEVVSTESALGGAADWGQLAHGWARKMIGSGTGQATIAIQFATLNDVIPRYLFGGQTHIAKTALSGRRFGHDYHFSAYGNPCIGLWNGCANEVGSSDTNVYQQVYSWNASSPATATLNLPTYKSEIYLGADQPLIQYDDNQERFNISQLHVAEVEGNLGEAGKGAPSAAPTTVVNANSDTVCYKVNKKLLRNNFTPDMAPYIALEIAAGSVTPKMDMLSPSLTPWNVYDAMGGIFIEEFCVPRYDWDTNLLGVMGFRWEQFNETPFSASGRQTRIIDYLNVSNIKYPTTNAKVNEGDLQQYDMNLWNNSLYNISLPMSSNVSSSVTNIHPAITIVGDAMRSTQILAQELPTKSLRPYYTIRSDIIGHNNFIGEAAAIGGKSGTIASKPIVGIVDKVNGYGDFYTEQNPQLVFTNTQPRVITSIKTSIHDPSGTYADCGLNTSVLYKIMKKTTSVDLTPVTTLLESKRKADQKEANEALAMNISPEPKPNFNFLDSSPPQHF
jgi:hypothetical protein